MATNETAPAPSEKAMEIAREHATVLCCAECGSQYRPQRPCNCGYLEMVSKCALAIDAALSAAVTAERERIIRDLEWRRERVCGNALAVAVVKDQFNEAIQAIRAESPPLTKGET